MDALNRDTIVVLWPVLATEQGGTALLPDWTQPPARRVEVRGCSWQPSTGNADDLAGVADELVGLVFGPLGMPVDGTCRIVPPGYDDSSALRVDGQPERHRTLIPHTVIRCSSWTEQAWPAV